MEDDFIRETQPAGDLNVPPRKPPTAVGTATPAPSPGERPLAVRAWRRNPRSSALTVAVNNIFDLLDRIGDTIAEKAGLRAGS